MNKFRIITLLFFIILSLDSKSQVYYEEVVYLKNGSIIHGMIVEQIPNKSIKIKTYDGNLFVFKMDEIEKITKELPVSSVNAKKIKTNPDTNNESTLLIGFKTGFNLTKFTNYTSTKDQKLVPRFQFSVLLLKKLNRSFSIQPEIQYSRQGYSLTSTNLDYDFVNEYINFTPLGRFDFGNKNTKFLLFGGPYLGYWINGKSVFTSRSNGNSKVETLYITDKDWTYVNRWEFGGSIGFGLSQRLNNNDQLIFDSKLSYGFNGIFKNVASSNNNNNLYNSFSIGYLHHF